MSVELAGHVEVGDARHVDSVQLHRVAQVCAVHVGQLLLHVLDGHLVLDIVGGHEHVVSAASTAATRAG